MAREQASCPLARTAAHAHTYRKRTTRTTRAQPPTRTLTAPAVKARAPSLRITAVVASTPSRPLPRSHVRGARRQTPPSPRAANVTVGRVCGCGSAERPEWSPERERGPRRSSVSIRSVGCSHCRRGRSGPPPRRRRPRGNLGPTGCAPGGLGKAHLRARHRVRRRSQGRRRPRASARRRRRRPRWLLDGGAAWACGRQRNRPDLATGTVIIFSHRWPGPCTKMLGHLVLISEIAQPHFHFWVICGSWKTSVDT